MSTKRIRQALEQTLLHDGAMVYALYLHELEELIEYLTESMRRDQDSFIFAVTEQKGDVAMLLIEPSGRLYINEDARAYLQHAWKQSYQTNLKRLIPAFTKQLMRNEMPINGVKLLNTAP